MFFYNIQFEGYDFDQVDEKGHVEFSEFEKVVREFPWKEQFEKRINVGHGASATISVINKISDHCLWLSIAANKKQPQFLIGYVYYKTKRPLFGIGNQKEIKWVDIYKIKDLETALGFFNLFFSDKVADLKQTLSYEKKFDSMKSQK